MVRSRKYALVTAALALILIAAVVLTVVLAGNGASYVPEQEAAASQTAVSVGSSTGEVSSDYIYQTLLSHSQKTGEWTESDMQDLQDAQGNHLDNGSTGGDGVKETYVTTLKTNFRLLTQNGLSDVEGGTLNVADKSWGGSGYYEVFHNGSWYRFNKTNSSDSDPLYMSYDDFMTDAAYYQNSSEYAMIVVSSISYNPNTTGVLQGFDATLDGAGTTLIPSKTLSVDNSTVDFSWFHDDDIKIHISKENNTSDGLRSVGLIFGSLRYGTFKNFKWNDSTTSGSKHQAIYKKVESGSAFGGLVGYAGRTKDGDQQGTSNVYNVSLTFNKDVLHQYNLTNYDDWMDSCTGTYTGGLIGINMNANIELVSIRMNNDIAFEEQSPSLTYPNLWRNADYGMSIFGGIVGVQNCNRTMSKVSISGTEHAALYGHHCKIERTQWGQGNRWSHAKARMSCVIGLVTSAGTANLQGVIVDFNYNEVYAWLDQSKTELYRGIIVGKNEGTISYSDVYLTNTVFAGTYEDDNKPGPEDIGKPAQGDDGGESFYPTGTRYEDGYKAEYWFDGDAVNDQSFAYIEESKVGEVSFSDDTDYMLEISVPQDQKGVYWNVTWSESGGEHTKKVNDDVFTQNSREDVKVHGFGAYDGNRTSNGYLIMTVEYASSYQLTPRNGVNNNGGDDKYYDKTMVNFPTLEASYLENYEMENHNAQLGQDGYVTIGDDGSGNLTFMMNNGSSPVGRTIDHIYIGGEDKEADISGNIASILQLERTAGEDFQVVDNNLSAWQAEYNANVYRWTLLDLFAVEDDQGHKMVFAPASNGINVKVEIDKRPIYMDVVTDQVPYTGYDYGVQYGSGSAANTVYYQFGTIATNGGEQAVISGDTVTLSQAATGSTAINAGDYTITAQGVNSGSNNYELINAPNTENAFTITPANVTLTVTGGSMPYGTTFEEGGRAAFMEHVEYTLDFGDSPLTGFAARDGITLNLNLMTTSSATSAGQYLFAPASGSGSVFAYAFPAGKYDVVVEGISGNGSGNYTFAVAQQGTGQFEVEMLNLAVNLPEISDFTYGDLDMPQVGEAVISGLRTGDQITSSAVKYFTAEDDAVYTPGTRFGAGSYYAQTVVSAISSPGSVNGLDNYNVVCGTSAFDVLKRDTYVLFDYDPAQTYVYQAAAYSFNASSLSNGAAGDGVSDVTFAAFSDSGRLQPAQALNAGIYYPGATSATLSDNYNVLGVRDTNGNDWATFEIEKASVTLALGSKTTAEYSGEEVPFDKTGVTITVADALQGEVESVLRAALTFTYNGAAEVPVNAGTYAVAVSLPELTNYNAATASLGSDALTITQMIITITPESSRVEKVYNGTVIPDLPYTITGSDGRPLNDEVTPDISYYVGEGTENVATSLRNVGTYTIVYKYDGTTGGNYASAEAKVTYEVTKMQLHITLNNKQVTYNKQAYQPDYDITTGSIIAGDVVNITFTVTKDGSAVSGDIVNAGEYNFTFGVDNANYALSDSYTVTIDPYTLTAQGLNTTILYNSAATGIEEYKSQINYEVLDVDGSVIDKGIDVSVDILEEGGAAATTIGSDGGKYQAKLTVTVIKSGPFDNDNYAVAEVPPYAIYIYKIALRSSLTGSVTYGTPYTVNGVLYAAAGQAGTQDLKVNGDGSVVMVEGADLGDVLEINIKNAVLTLSGANLIGESASGSKTLTNGADASVVFNGNVFDEQFTKPVDAGSYTLTVKLTVEAVYEEGTTSHPENKRTVIITAPFTWTVDPLEIAVKNLGQLNKYYTETISAADVMGVVEMEEQYKEYVTAVSAAIGGTYVNAGWYEYDLVLNTGVDGYYNYTLDYSDSAEETGKIHVQKLTLQVSADNAEVEYGNAVTPSVTTIISKGETPLTEEEISALGAAFTSQYSYTTALTYQPGNGVGLYEGAIVLSVTATENFTVEKTDGNVNVIPRKIQITLGNLSMVYGTEQLPALTYTLTGGTTLFTGDDMPALATDGLTLDGAAAPAVNRINANSYAYDFTSLSSQDDNYEITAHNGGTLTVTPYVITSVTWDESAKPVYKGSEFAAEELFTIADMDMPNGDVVTFGVAYTDGQGGNIVKNAGAYTAVATVASVTNGTDPVEAGNYDVSRVATRNLNVAQATLTLSGVAEAAEEGGAFILTVTYDPDGDPQEISASALTFTFGAATYAEDNDGALTVTIAYTQNGFTASPVNAGTYSVSVTVSGANFVRSTFTNISLVINKLQLTTLDGFANVTAPADAMFNNLFHEPTVEFLGVPATYSFTYFKVTESEGTIVKEPADPVDAAHYYALLTIDSANVYYVTTGEYEVEFDIAPTDKISLDISIPTSTGLNENNVYYTGTGIRPTAEATITQFNPAQVYVTDDAAFTYKFYKVATTVTGTTVEINGVQYNVMANGYALDEAIDTGSYYVEYWFNIGRKFNGNYEERHGFMMSGDEPLIMQITTGNMGIRFISVATQEYSGLAGFNGRDVIYQEDGNWFINTDLITFSGVDLNGMTDLMEQLKTGEIVITVSYRYDMTDGVARYTKLYDYTWGFDANNQVRTTPAKKYYAMKTDPEAGQIEGPYGNVTDLGYANGQTAAVYLIEVRVDNRHSADVPENLKDVVSVPDSGSSYSSAMEVYTDEDGNPIRDDNNNLQYVPTYHRGSGTISFEPAQVEFEMLYTSDFYNDGKNMLAGGYNELNDVAASLEEFTQELLDKAQFILRGVAIPASAFEYSGDVKTNPLVKSVDSSTAAVSVNVTGSNYTDTVLGEKVRYEVLDKRYFHLTVTNEEGKEVYTYNVDGFNNGSQNVGGANGITNAGTYTFEFVFDGMNGKYAPFSYTWDFVQQAAEYHITVTQEEGVTLTTPFGTEFDLTTLNGALKATLEDGELATETGHYQMFEEAFKAGQYDDYITLFGDDGSGIPYTDYQVLGVESPVGQYYISYVFVSKDKNLEIMMETQESMIEVTATAPGFLADEDGNPIKAPEGEEGEEGQEQNPGEYNIGSVSYSAGNTQTEYVLSKVRLGLEYTTLPGNTNDYAPYTTENVGIFAIQYLADGSEDWVELPATSSIMSVGKYKIWFAADGDNNLEGSVSDQYVLFEITKINATAFVTGADAVNGQTYTGYDFSLGWKITDESGLDVQAAVLGGEVNIMVKFGEGEFVAGGKINEAGTYTVYVTAAGSANYNVKDSEQVQIVINKADLNVRFAQSYYTAVYNENGNTIAPDQVSYELNGRRVSNAGGASDVYYLLMDEEGKVTNESAQQMVEAYLTANSELDLDEWAAQNGYTDFVFTSVGDAAAATDVGVYLPIVVYEGDGNYVKSARLIANGAYPEFEITKAAMQAILVASQKYVVTYGDAIADITSADTVLKHFTLAWKKQVGIGSDGSPEYADVDDIATSGAVIAYSMLNLNIYTKGDDIGTYANAYELEIKFSHKNYELDYQTAYTSVEVKPYALSVDLANAQVYLEKDGESSAQALTAAGVTFNKVYQGASFGRLTFVFKDAEGNVLNTGFGLEGQNVITQEHGFGAYGVLSVAAADEGGFVAGTATIAGEYNTKVVFTLNNGNYTVTINGADGALATLTPNTTQDPDAASYSVDVKMNVEKAVLRLLFDTVTYTWGTDGEYTETATPSTRADHVGWWEYSTIWTGYKFEESDRVYIQSGYFDKSGEFVPFGMFETAARLGDERNGAELALVIDDGDSGNLAAVGEYNIHISTNSANYVIANANNEVPIITVTPEGGGTPVQTQNNMIDINITIARSPALEVTAALGGDENANIPALFTQDGEAWSRPFDGMTINSKTILGDYLAVYRYKRTQATVKGSIAAPDATVQLVRDGDRDFSDSIFASGINVTFAGANGTALDAIINAGTYKMTVSVELTTNEVDITEYTLVIAPAPASDFTANVRNKARSSQTYNGEALVPNFTFTLAIAEELNGTVHTLDVTSYAVQVFKDGAEQPLLTYNVKNGVAELGKEQRALLANAGSYTFKLVVNSPNAEENAAFEVNTSAGTPLTFTIARRDLSKDGIDIAFKDHFDYTTEGGQPVAVDEERLELSIYYDRTLKLISGTDYTVTFENGKGGKYTGTYDFTISGTGNFMGTLTRSYSVGASVGLTQAPGSIVYGSDSVTVVLTVNSMDPAQGDGSLNADMFGLSFNGNVCRLVSGNTTVSQLTLVGGEPVYADGKFTVTFGGLRAVNAGEYYLDLSFTCVYDGITSEGKINAQASGEELCKVTVTPASVEQAAESVSAVLTSVNSTSVTFNISGTPRAYEYSLDNGQTWVKAVKGNNVISALAPEQNVTVTLRVNDGNYATAEGVHEYNLDETLAATTTASVDDILTAAEELARSFNATGFTRYAELLQQVENISAADREARGAEIDEALAAVEEARSEYIEDLQGAIDSAVNAAERAAGKASATTTATAAATAGALSLPLFGIGMVFAARKRNKKEDDLND